MRGMRGRVDKADNADVALIRNFKRRPARGLALYTSSLVRRERLQRACPNRQDETLSSDFPDFAADNPGHPGALGKSVIELQLCPSENSNRFVGCESGGDRSRMGQVCSNTQECIVRGNNRRLDE